MKKLIILFLSLIIFLPAEDKIQRNAFVVDLGGPGGITTLEYQFTFIKKNNHTLSIPLAFGTGGLWFTAGTGLQYTYGDNNRLLLGMYFLEELIADFDNEYEDDWFFESRLMPKLGYQRKTQLFYRDIYVHIYFSPMIRLSDGRFIPWFGLGIMQNF
ncbi:MAG: hypothetical protein KAU44_08230 [Candidatus Marinimicrobia bacterium]|nr:hypothetical protein [Candidatus Neomarinimicrobiota bacterium]